MHKALPRRWCDAMLKYQLHDTGDTRLDGGLLCPACIRVHGRAGSLTFAPRRASNCAATVKPIVAAMI